MSEKLEQKLLSLAQAAEIKGVSQDYLRILIFRGKLKALKLGRNWNTTEEWLGEYFDHVNGNGISRINKSDTILADTPKEILAEPKKDTSVQAEKLPKILLSLGLTAFAVGIFASPHLGSFIDDTMGDTMIPYSARISRHELLKRLPEINPVPFETIDTGIAREVAGL